MAELKRCKKCGKIYSWNSYFNGYMCECGNIERRAITNADRIRAMSDEELAVFVRAIIMAEDCPVTGCDCDKCFFKEPCFNGSKWHSKETEWLKQPAEEVHADG